MSPADPNAVEVLRFGGHRMIKGPTKRAVLEKLLELVQTGANVVQRPTRVVDGGWIAVCDNASDFYKW